jgi:V-type H+-transporting ATPase subunit a
MYSFGFDPMWMKSNSDVAFYNSFKMKTSVILGVLQMTLGLVLKGLNAIHFGRMYDFYHEFLPQIIMLTSMFGYMDFMII